jgi:ABC-2 type transport system ATP-binding protein
VSGEDVSKVGHALAHDADLNVTPFGSSLHVSARDKEALEKAIAPYRNDPTLKWVPSPPSLEDVFIDLMSRARDNFQ